jgi:hypothetical protein
MTVGEPGALLTLGVTAAGFGVEGIPGADGGFGAPGKLGGFGIPGAEGG